MKQVIFVMKLFLITGILISCQQDDVVSAKKPDQPQLHSSLKTDLEDSIDDDGQGGPTEMYPVPAVDGTSMYGLPFVLRGKSTAIFTNTGELTSSLIAVGYAENGPWYPIYDVFQHGSIKETWLWLGTAHVENNVRYIVRGFPIAVVPGYSPMFVKDARVQVLLSGAGIGDMNKWVEGHEATTFSGPTLGYWSCSACNTARGMVEGKMTVNYFNMDSEGRLSITYTLKIGTLVLNVSRVNFVRVTK